MNKLINFENVVKGLGIVITISALYWGIINRINLMEAKLDYYIANAESEKKRSELVITDIKSSCKEYDKELAMLRERIVEIRAILPKQIKLEDEN